MYRKIREKDIAKYHVQLCLALLTMYILTLILVVLSAERVDTIYGGCVFLSLLVHYFTLVAVMWMGAEGLLMFQKLAIVFVQITAKFIVTVSIVCWSKWNLIYNVVVAISSHCTCSICSCTHWVSTCSFHCGYGKWS